MKNKIKYCEEKKQEIINDIHRYLRGEIKMKEIPSRHNVTASIVQHLLELEIKKMKKEYELYR